jgi:hypothetical protein
MIRPRNLPGNIAVGSSGLKAEIQLQGKNFEKLDSPSEKTCRSLKQAHFSAAAIQGAHGNLWTPLW